MVKKLFTLMLFVFVVTNLFAAGLETDRNLQTPAIYDFEDPAENNTWKTKGSANWVTEKCKVQSFAGGPDSLKVFEKTGEKKENCLGIKASFKSIGYNWIEVYRPKPIDLVGRVKSISLWVAGMKYRYTVEIWLKDYLGFEHRLILGRIDYEGWRNLVVKIPASIPQEEKWLPKEKVLSVTRIVFRSDPDERADKFYCYIDHLKITTDIFIRQYDGIELLKNLW